MDKVKPTPGSDKAVEQGCTCPIFDNRKGAGFSYGNERPYFWITETCPLHGAADDEQNTK